MSNKNAKEGVTISGNTVGNTQFGIAFVSDPTFGPADGGTVTGNKVAATHIFDGIELCGSSNTYKATGSTAATNPRFTWTAVAGR